MGDGAERPVRRGRRRAREQHDVAVAGENEAAAAVAVEQAPRVRRTAVGHRGHRWMFTWNAPRDAPNDVPRPDGWSNEFFTNLKVNGFPVVRYFVAQKERGELTHNLHWQGYFELYESTRMNAVKELLFGDRGATVHLQIAVDDAENNTEYCTKEEQNRWNKGGRIQGTEPIKYGTPASCSAVKQKLAEVVHFLMHEGGTMAQVRERYPVIAVQHGQKIQHFIDHRARDKAKVRRDVYTEVVVGPPGLGKTHNVYTKYGTTGVYTKKAESRHWFPFYAGEKVLLLDDFTDWMSIEQLMSICDPYCATVEYKGGHYVGEWQQIIITSNFRPEEWWSGKYRGTPSMDALIQRINKVTYLDMTHSTPYRELVKRFQQPLPVDAVAPAEILAQEARLQELLLLDGNANQVQGNADAE